jgi:hypothetical protein
VDEELCAKDAEKCADRAFDEPTERVYSQFELDMLAQFALDNAAKETEEEEVVEPEPVTLYIGEIDSQGKTSFIFNQPMAVPENWQLIKYGSSFRLVLKSQDGSEVMGQYEYGFGGQSSRRNLLAVTRCQDSCDSENKAFTWTVDSYEP